MTTAKDMLGEALWVLWVIPAIIVFQIILAAVYVTLRIDAFFSSRK